jgi:hypothetical protein
MSQTTESETDSEAPERIRLADGVEILDAFVDWNVNCSNPPELVVRTNAEIGLESFEPFTNTLDDDRLLELNDYGVYHGVQPHLPVSEETGMASTTVEHIDGEIEVFESMHHTVANDVNEMAPQTALSVTVNAQEGYVDEWAMDVATVNVIIERYLNGPLGSDTTSYWLWKRDPHEWKRATSSREDREDYEHSTIRLVADEIYTWYPMAEWELSSTDETYTET